MTDRSVFYASPSTEPVRLWTQPRLASWNAAMHPDQIQLSEYLEHARSLAKRNTIAAITGGPVGAAYGASAVPSEWRRRRLHGWPGLTGRDLFVLVSAIERRGAADPFDYAYRGWGSVGQLARHPYDDQVWLGGIGALRRLRTGVTGVVSLSRVGDDDMPATRPGWKCG